MAQRRPDMSSDVNDLLDCIITSISERRMKAGQAAEAARRKGNDPHNNLSSSMRENNLQDARVLALIERELKGLTAEVEQIVQDW